MLRVFPAGVAAPAEGYLPRAIVARLLRGAHKRCHTGSAKQPCAAHYVYMVWFLVPLLFSDHAFLA